MRAPPVKASSVLPNAMTTDVVRVPAVVALAAKAPMKIAGQRRGPPSRTAASAMPLGGQIGLALGLAGAVAATRLLASLLFEVKPNDPMVYAGLSLLLGVVTLAAVSVPAWRATRVAPVVALRQE